MALIKIDKSSWIIIGLFVVVFIYAFLKRYNLRSHPFYAKGISEGIKKGVHGSRELHYYFISNNDTIKGFTPVSFTKGFPYKCRDVGDTVIVRFESGNPKNNDLVSNAPDSLMIN